MTIWGTLLHLLLSDDDIGLMNDDINYDDDNDYPDDYDSEDYPDDNDNEDYSDDNDNEDDARTLLHLRGCLPRKHSPSGSGSLDCICIPTMMMAMMKMVVMIIGFVHDRFIWAC